MIRGRDRVRAIADQLNAIGLAKMAMAVIHHRKMRAKRQIKFKGRPGEGRFLKLI